MSDEEDNVPQKATLTKVLFVGNGTVGKSCLVKRIASPNKEMETNTVRTVGIDFLVHVVNETNPPAKLQMWDTSGDERFFAIRDSYFRGIKAVVYVGDCTEGGVERLRDTYNSTKELCVKGTVIAFVVNKTDLDGPDSPIQKQYAEWVRENAPPLSLHFNVSAKTGQNVREMVVALACRVVNPFVAVLGDTARAADLIENPELKLAFNFVTTLNDVPEEDVDDNKPPSPFHVVVLTTSEFIHGGEKKFMRSISSRHAVYIITPSQSLLKYAHAIRGLCKGSGSIFTSVYIEDEKHWMLNTLLPQARKGSVGEQPSDESSHVDITFADKVVQIGVENGANTVSPDVASWACSVMLDDGVKRISVFEVDGRPHVEDTPMDGSRHIVRKTIRMFKPKSHAAIFSHAAGQNTKGVFEAYNKSKTHVFFMTSNSPEKVHVASPMLSPIPLTVGTPWEMSPAPVDGRAVSWEEQLTLSDGGRFAPTTCFYNIIPEAYTCGLASQLSRLKDSGVLPQFLGTEYLLEAVALWLGIGVDKAMKSPISIGGTMVQLVPLHGEKTTLGKAVTLLKDSSTELWTEIPHEMPHAPVLVLEDNSNGKTTRACGLEGDACVMPCTLATGAGLHEGLKWIADHLVTQDVSKAPPCVMAALNGQVDVLRILITEGKVDVNEADDYGTTPCYAAAQNGHADALRFLITEGKADVNKAENDGATPCFVAAQNGHADSLRILITEGNADVNKDNNGSTPCYMAAQNGHADALRILITVGKADVNKDKNGTTPCFMAAQNGHADSLRILITEGKADVNKANKNGATPCFMAAQNGQVDALRILITEGKADVNMANNNGSTPCYMAAQNGHADALRILITEGKADVNKDKNGTTPCFMAAQNGHADSLRILITEGKADVDKANKNGATPCFMAAQNGQVDALRILITEGNADVNKADNNGATPCFMAAQNGHADSLRILITEGKADVDKANKNGATPCFMAAQNGQVDTLRILITEGNADVNKADNNGATPCFMAAQNGLADSLRILITEGKADVNKADNNGATPYSRAASKEHTDALHILITEGKADVKKALSDGDVTQNSNTE